jgi:hypothetical protein
MAFTLYSVSAAPIAVFASSCRSLRFRSLRGVAEVVADGRLQHLRDQIRHGSKARNHLGRVVARNVNDLAHVQVECKAVRRTHRDGRKLFVQLVRLALPCRPVENDVGGGHKLDLVREGIDGILARIERIEPHALLPAAHQVAMLEAVAGYVPAFIAHIGDDHANVGNGNICHRLGFDGGEARIDEIAAGQNHLLLKAFMSAVGDEGLGILIHVVAGNFLARDLARGQRLAVLRCHHPHHVVGNLKHLCGGNLKQRCVDAIGAGRNDGDLRPALAAAREESPRILK